MYLRPLLIVVLSIIMGESSFAQSQVNSFRKNEIRFKALAMVFVEDEWINSASVGWEHRFNEKYSWSADLVHLRQVHEREVWAPTDTFAYGTYREFPQRDKRNYLVLEGRRYLFLDKNYRVEWYTNIYNKAGFRRVWTHWEFPLKLDDVLRLNSYFIEPGWAIGMKTRTKLRIDGSLGLGYRWEFITSKEVYRGVEGSRFDGASRHFRPFFHIRLNFTLPIGS